MKKAFELVSKVLLHYLRFKTRLSQLFHLLSIIGSTSDNPNVTREVLVSIWWSTCESKTKCSTSCLDRLFFEKSPCEPHPPIWISSTSRRIQTECFETDVSSTRKQTNLSQSRPRFREIHQKALPFSTIVFTSMPDEDRNQFKYFDRRLINSTWSTVW